MNDHVTLDELIERYRSERDPAEPPLVTAASALTWAGDRLADDTRGTLATRGMRTWSNHRAPPEIQFSGQPGARVSPGEAAVIDEREAIAYPDSSSDVPERMVVPDWNLTVLMLGLVMEERVDRFRAELAVGRLSPRALSQDDYVEVFGTVDGSEAGEIIGCFGWAFSGLVAIVAGMVVALIAWNAWLFLPVALGGAILGYLAAIGVMLIYDWVDLRWLRLGRQDQAGLVILLIGPAVALLIALSVLGLA